MIVCAKCGSDDIQQEASIMLNPNEAIVGKIGLKNLRMAWGDFHWQDFYWCKKCDDACQWDEVPDGDKN